MAPIRHPSAHELGQRMRERRKKLRLSQRQVAELAGGTSQKYVGEIERGEMNPSFLKILALAAALEVDPAELVAGLRP